MKENRVALAHPQLVNATSRAAWKTTLSFPALAIAFSMVILNPISTLASEDENILRAEAIRLFQENKFSSVVEVGNAGLKLKPNDDVLRYYLATALTKMGRKGDALTQYRQCLSITQDGQLKGYCTQAITTLTNPAAPPIRTAPIQAQASSQTGNGEEALNERKQIVLEEKEQQVQNLRRTADRQIADIEKDIQNQLADVPQYVQTTMGYGRFARLREVPNPNYGQISENLHRQAQVKIDAINDDCKNRQEDLSAAYDKKAAMYDNVAPNMQSQFRSGTSLSQVTPKGTNGYVRNIVNYGADPDPLSPLRAKVGTLQQVQK